MSLVNVNRLRYALGGCEIHLGIAWNNPQQQKRLYAANVSKVKHLTFTNLKFQPSNTPYIYHVAYWHNFLTISDSSITAYTTKIVYNLTETKIFF